MRRTLLILGLTLVVGIALGVIGTQLLSAQQEPVKRSVLLKTDLAGMEGKEELVIHVTLAPEAAAGKHYHSGHELAYVLEGSGTLEVEGKPPLAFKAGQAVYLAPKQIHDAKNASKSAPLKILAVAIVEKGQPPPVQVK